MPHYLDRLIILDMYHDAWLLFIFNVFLTLFYFLCILNFLPVPLVTTMIMGKEFILKCLGISNEVYLAHYAQLL